MPNETAPPSLLDLIERFETCAAELDDARSMESRAETALRNAGERIVAALVPKDAQAGERFAIPVGDSFFEVRVVDGRRPGCEIADRGATRTVVGWRNGKPPSKVGTGGGVRR